MNSDHKISKIRVPARPYQLKQVRCIVQNAMKGLGYPSAEIEKIVLAVNEACMNIIQHAYKDNNSGEFIVEILKNSEDIIFRLTDFAEPVETCDIKGRDLDDVRPGGLGVHFMHEVMDAVSFYHRPEGVGNVLEMRKKLAP